MNTFDSQLHLAIANKRLIEIRYNGIDRIVEPHDYGVQNGSEKLLAYQLRSPIISGSNQSPVGWRLFNVDKIESCVILVDVFRGGRGPSHEKHLSWDVLYARATP